MAAGGDNDLWNDLFGGNDSADAQAQPPTTTAASSAPEKKEKEKKDKKGKKDKEKDKEKKDKKEKDKDGKKEAAPLPSPVEVVEPAQVAEPIKAAEPAKKEKKAGKDKDKKDKKDKEKDKEKKDKKAKKDKGGDEGVPAPADTTTAVLLPVIEDSQPAPTMEEVTQSLEKKGKEKKDKDKKDKSEKKEKKEKKKDAEDLDGKPDAEKKEKKEKKDKKDKEDKKEKKKDKKEEKEKKRKAEAEINEEDKRPKLDDEVAEIQDGQEAPETETADNLFDVFDMSKDLAAEEEDPFGNIDIFDDVFAQAFAGMDEPEPEAVVQAPTAADDKGPSQRPRVDMPIVPEFFSSKKKDKEKAKVMQEAEKEPETISHRWAQVMEHCKVKKALAISEQDSVPYIQDFIQSMVQAAEDDLADFQRGTPMLHKMRLLQKAVSIMQKYAFAEIFVIYEGCSALAKWLNVLPNGELPNVHIRTNLLKCMMRLPITKETLANCKGVPLGAVVAKLQNNPLETVANRKMAGMLVQKWLKQVLSKSQMDGFDLDQLQEADLPKATIPRPAPETEESLKALEAESAKRMHPQIPILEGKQYNIQPLPKDMPVRREKKNLDSNRGKLAEVLKVMSRPNKKSWKPYTVCIAGRTINAI